MNLKLAREWLPPVVYQSLLQCAAEIKFIAYSRKDILRKNLHLKGTRKGRRAFLLATGPSINQENLELLAGEDCFSISNFFLHNEIQTINPLFHGFAPYHEPLILENYVEWLRLADKTLPLLTKIILGHSTFDIVKKFHLFPDRDVYYVYLTPHPLRKSVDLLRPVLAPQTGPLLLLPLLIYMGYEQIYLLGCDHTILRDFKKTITNFYDKKLDIRANATTDWHGIIESLGYVKNTFEQYGYYRDLSQNGEKFSIVNLSRDSWLDLFPSGQLDNIVNRI